MLTGFAITLWSMLGVAVPVQAQLSAPDPTKVVEQFFDAYRAGDVERLIGIMSPVVCFADPTARLSANGRDELRRMTSSIKSSYSDIEIQVHSITANASRVAVEVTVAAVVTRKDGSKRNVRVRGASFFRVKEGLIETWTDYFDAQTLREQLSSGG